MATQSTTPNNLQDRLQKAVSQLRLMYKLFVNARSSPRARFVSEELHQTQSQLWATSQTLNRLVLDHTSIPQTALETQVDRLEAGIKAAFKEFNVAPTVYLAAWATSVSNSLTQTLASEKAEPVLAQDLDLLIRIADLEEFLKKLSKVKYINDNNPNPSSGVLSFDDLMTMEAKAQKLWAEIQSALTIEPSAVTA